MALSQEKLKHNQEVHRDIENIIKRACSFHVYPDWDEENRSALQLTIARMLGDYKTNNSAPVIHDEDGWTYALENFEVMHNVDDKQIRVEANWMPLRKWHME